MSGAGGQSRCEQLFVFMDQVNAMYLVDTEDRPLSQKLKAKVPCILKCIKSRVIMSCSMCSGAIWQSSEKT